MPGVLFGCAVLTKDEGVLLTVLPLLAGAVLRWGPRRAHDHAHRRYNRGGLCRLSWRWSRVNGYFDILWQAKTAGIERMLGLVQTTGFNSSGGGGSLSSRLLAEASYFGTTYIMLDAGRCPRCCWCCAAVASWGGCWCFCTARQV